MAGNSMRFFGPVKGLGVEEKRVAGAQVINLVAMAVTDFTLEHIDEFHAGMVEHRKRFGFFGKSNEIRLNSGAFANGVAEKLILMPRPWCRGARSSTLLPLERKWRLFAPRTAEKRP